MSNVAIQKVEDQSERSLPVFAEVAKRLQDVKCRAFELFERRRSELGNALADWLRAEREVFGWSAAEMSEQDSEYELQMTLPGFDAKEVQVTATPSEILVHAETKSAKTEKPNLLWTELSLSDVYRRFELPESVDVDKVRATLDKGVLRITAAKAVAAKDKPTATAA